MYLIFGGISAGSFFSVVHGNRDRLGYGRSRFDPGLRSSLFLIETLSMKDQKLSKCLRNDSDTFTIGKFLRRDPQPRTLGWKLHMLWLKFILGLNFISLCFKLIIIHFHTPKQREIKFKPRIKLNHNIYMHCLTTHTFLGLIITITKFSNLIGYQLP